MVAEAAKSVRNELKTLWLDDPRHVDLVSDAYRRFERDAKETLEEMRVHLPEASAAIERRLARRMALNFEEAELMALARDGAIGDVARQKSYDALQERQKRLYFDMTFVQLPDTAELCRQTDLFADLAEEVVDDLAEMTVEQVVAKGEWLFHEGDRGDSLYIVARGVVEVVREGGAQPEVLALLGGGDLLGEMALLTGDKRGAGARAATPLTVGRISRADFEQLLKTCPEVVEKLWTTLCRRLLDNRLRSGALGEVSAEEHRRLVRDSEVGVYREGTMVRAGPEGAFVADGDLRGVVGVARRGDFIPAHAEMVCETDVRLIELPQPNRESWIGGIGGPAV